MKEIFNQKTVKIILKIILSIMVFLSAAYFGILGYLVLYFENYSTILSALAFTIIPVFFLPLIWFKKKKKWLIISIVYVLLYLIALGVNWGIMQHEDSLSIDTAPNINVDQYLPFAEDTKIVKLENASLQLTEDLPIVDGAAAVFPVYSAFVYAVYPDGITIDESVLDEDINFKTELEAKNSPLRYNNTKLGYKYLGERKTDIFFGAYPSKAQIDTAQNNGTEFEFTQIGSEAFVFFVHKDNPIENLTSQQIKDIYSGKITNWKDVGGKNEEIVAFQRNEGSGSQSMLIRFMGDTPIMNAPIEQTDDLMGGIIKNVANYKNKTSSIGFSFRYYVEGIIKNPDIKMISIDGVAPTVKNVKNATYPITTPLYAVSYKGNPNPNVKRLLDWILSPEGQKIIEETGYVGV